MKYAQMPLKHGGSSTNKPNRVIIHAMGEFIDDKERDYSAYEWLDKLGLSAHILLTPSGVPIQCRDDGQKAWHAKNNNTNTLGIEFLVPGLHNYSTFLKAIKEPYLTDQQYSSGIEVINKWLVNYKLTKDAVTTHHIIDPDRKFDPGDGFPLDRFLNDLIII